MENETPSPRERPVIRYKIHWHVVLTHFPLSLFLASGGLMFLHLVTGNSCYELATYLALLGGAVAMVPTTLTGWFTWKRNYEGLRSRLFLNKVIISFVMTGISFLLVILRNILEPRENLTFIWHIIYFAGILLLAFGAFTEGYYGGRLNHR